MHPCQLQMRRQVQPDNFTAARVTDPGIITNHSIFFFYPVLTLSAMGDFP